jgi:hypothetical protein
VDLLAALSGQRHAEASSRRHVLAVLLVALVAVASSGSVLSLTASATSPAAPATDATVRSGLWSDPSTWVDGQLPGPGTAVTITAGDFVVLDVNTQVSGMVVNGDLAFDPAQSIDLLSNHNVIVNGALTMTPDSAEQVHRLRFIAVDDSKFVGGGVVPLASDVGLWVMGSGRLDLNGAAKTAWTHLAGQLDAGQSTGIGLQTSPVGWRTGDEIFVAPTQAPTNAVGSATWAGFEDTTLTDVQSTTISIATPAARVHPVVNGTSTAEIGDLTRNVKIEGTASGYSHVFIRSSSPQTIRYVELTDMGVAGILGRYPLHFHLDGDGSRGTVVDGVVIHKSMNHAFVPHGSNGITFTDTIAYDIGNDAYWWDADTQRSTGNGSSKIVFDHAIAANVHGPSGIGLTGFRLGQGQNSSNTIRDSVATGVAGNNESSGFAWKLSTNTWNFQDNVAHNNKIAGIFVWENNSQSQSVDGFAAYYDRIGIAQGAYKNQYHYSNVSLYGNSKIGLELLATANKNGLVFDNLHIDGAGITQIGIFACCHQLDGSRYPTVISNCTVSDTIFGSVWVGAGQGRNSGDKLQFVNCTLGGKQFYVESPTPADGSIEYTSPTAHFGLTTARPAGPSMFVATWNAWRTHLP